MKKILTTLRFEHTILLGLLLIVFAVLVASNFSISNEQQFVYQAESFLHGRLDLLDQPGTWADAALVDGKYYWPLGPFPAVVLMPFVAVFGYSMLQGYLQLLVTFGVVLLAFAIARTQKMTKTDALWFATAFAFASVYVGVALIPWSWYFAQVVTTVLLLGALYEFFTHKRWWLIGLLMAAVLGTRIGASFSILFFVCAILFSKDTWRQKCSHLTQLIVPWMIVGGLLLGMNKVRFGSYSNNGYLLQDVQGPNGLNRELYGLFSIKNVLPNIFNYFFRIPLFFPRISQDASQLYPQVFPASVFIISPFFLWPFRAFIKKYRQPLTWFLLIGSSITIIALMFYYASGQRLGPRYIVDVLPFWYILLLFAFKEQRLQWYHKTLIGVSVVFNLLLGLSVFYA